MLQEKHNVPAPEEGLYVVFVSLHVKTEENTKKNNRKKRKKRSFRSDKTQIKMELCGTDKCKPNRSVRIPWEWLATFQVEFLH